jgi:hypothetical protein
MATVSAPFGLRPAFSPSGVVRPTAYTIASAYGANILDNQPVKIGANGTLEAAAAGERFIGTFCGVEYTNTQGRRVVDNKWLSGTVGTDIIAYATLDPSIVYEIQADGPIAVADIGSQADFTAAGTGSTVTGLSAMMLAAGTITNSASQGLRIIGISSGPNNAPGDAFTIVQVQISEHQNVADRVAY